MRRIGQNRSTRLPALKLSSGALLIVYGAVILFTVSIGSDASDALGRRIFRRRPNARKDLP
jgi:hypothetical protein